MVTIWKQELSFLVERNNKKKNAAVYFYDINLRRFEKKKHNICNIILTLNKWLSFMLVIIAMMVQLKGWICAKDWFPRKIITVISCFIPSCRGSLSPTLPLKYWIVLIHAWVLIKCIQIRKLGLRLGGFYIFRFH